MDPLFGLLAVLGLLAGPLAIWAAAVFIVAYALGRVSRSRRVGLAIWIAGLSLPVFGVIVPLPVAVLLCLATGAAWWWHSGKSRRRGG